MIVAVKRLNQESFQGHQEWLGLLMLNHSWILRIKIALDAAKGLSFLHSDKAKVIYRDLKASNILLDSNYNAKLSDFGLAKDGPTGSKSHVSTRVMGTYGYAAPEYMATGHLTKKSDIYSFGVVLLEILSGRRAIDKSKPTREQNLVDWARHYLGSKRKVFQVMDARLEGQYSLKDALKAANLAVQCLSTEPRFRPNVEELVKELEQLLESNDNNGSRGSQSENPEKLIEIQAMVLNIEGEMPRKFLMEKLPVIQGHLLLLFIHKKVNFVLFTTHLSEELHIASYEYTQYVT
ncbi:hypothetical protein GH714_010942 [Hevea brasiliensis]|uniref:Protein kinase domain-containing protein n=1 Tax=Hevea brasiliensis TaxID=3981 RepID=A0A6A6N0A6_HEVBR|nr:hypothetical protein GH714_010942 [Hevea brasiliensis]